jgi:hypothetical protein
MSTIFTPLNATPFLLYTPFTLYYATSCTSCSLSHSTLTGSLHAARTCREIFFTSLHTAPIVLGHSLAIPHSMREVALHARKFTGHFFCTSTLRHSLLGHSSLATSYSLGQTTKLGRFITLHCTLNSNSLDQTYSLGHIPLRATTTITVWATSLRIYRVTSRHFTLHTHWAGLLHATSTLL